MAAASANLFSVFAAALEGAITWDAVWQVFLAVLPVWLFGAVAGWAAGHLLPRPKAQTQPSTWLLTLFSGSGWRKFLLMVHGAVILRDVWRTYTQPGTLRGLSRALWSWVRGQGFHFEFPQGDAVAGDFAVEQQAEGTGLAPLRDADNWYVTHKDLAFFKYHGLGSGAVEGASDWEVMMEKEMPNELKYTAWRRTLPCGKTEYKSVTIAPDATANEFIDIYFDDDFRPRWDGMVVHHEVLEHGDFSQRQQVVRWIRRFPFKFLSDREYIIARRMFKEGQDLYGVTKSIRHPRAPHGSKVVRCDTFHSMWRSRNVACPWGTANPACETILLHHEQFKIPEHLARFAVRHAMWGFIKHMAAVVPEFVARRREVCSPFEMNAAAYGSGFLPNPPMGRSETSKSSLSLSSFGSSGDTYGNAMPASASQQSLRYRHSTGGLALCGSGCLDGMGEAGEEGEQGSATAGAAGMRRSKSSNLKGLAAVAIASGVAILINKNSSTTVSASTGNVKSLAKRHRELRRKESRVFNL